MWGGGVGLLPAALLAGGGAPALRRPEAWMTGACAALASVLVLRQVGDNVALVSWVLGLACILLTLLTGRSPWLKSPAFWCLPFVAASTSSQAFGGDYKNAAWVPSAVMLVSLLIGSVLASRKTRADTPEQSAPRTPDRVA
jgi:hypothetical protein